MNRKTDLSSVLLFTAIFFGAVVRFYPAIVNGSPLNDGGMFYVMSQDLRANDFQLPEHTTYNLAHIPYAYPPLGFYIAAISSVFIPGSDLLVFTYLPAFIATLCIPAFYLFAKELLNSKLAAAVGTLFYTFSWTAYLWLVMGGGLTRALGMLFLLLMFWQSIRLFRGYSHQKLLLAIFFGVGTVTSHPQIALHAVLAGLLAFILYGLNRKGILSAMRLALGVAILSAPWWAVVVSNHGIETILAAGNARPRNFEAYTSLLSLGLFKDINLSPIHVLAFIGVPVTWKRKEFLPVLWIIIALIIDPLASGGMTLLFASILAAIGFIQLAAWINHLNYEQTEMVLTSRRSLALLFGLLTWLMVTAFAFDINLLGYSLRKDDLKLFEWVHENIEGDKTFLLATGREFSFSDPWQEWFPALTGQRSATTLQGLEWTYGDNFYPWYDELIAFQHCYNVECVRDWAVRNDVDYDYLIVLRPDDIDVNSPLKQLEISAIRSPDLQLIYETEEAYIFELKK